jgi:hypothetical protein
VRSGTKQFVSCINPAIAMRAIPYFSCKFVAIIDVQPSRRNLSKPVAQLKLG